MRVGIVAVWLVLGAVKYHDEMLAYGLWEGTAGGGGDGRGGGGGSGGLARGVEMGLQWMRFGFSAVGASVGGLGSVGGVAAPGHPGAGGGGMGMDILEWARWMDWWVIIAGAILCGRVAGQKGYTGMLLTHSSFFFYHICIHIYICPQSINDKAIEKKKKKPTIKM